MKTFLKILTLGLYLIVCQQGQSQFVDRLLKKAEKAAQRGVENTVERKVEEKASKKTEDVLEADKKIKINKKDKKGKNKSDDSQAGEMSTGLEEQGGLSESGANEVGFKRGSKIIFQDNFEKDAVGDFPARWNSNGSGEVKKLKGLNEKWLKIPAKSVVNIELTKPLPENFTLEFDMIIPSDAPLRMAGFGIGEKPIQMDYLLANKNAVHVYVNSNDRNHEIGLMYGRETSSADYVLKKVDYSPKLNKPIKFAVEVNGRRFRLYIDGAKRIDMPTVMEPKIRKSIYFNALAHGAKESLQNYFYISNVVLAETGKDERSQVLKDLIDKGSFTTNAILFAKGSDKLESSSNDVLNSILEALNQEPNMKLKITGHTDSDGDEKKNLTLSKKRAEAVKKWLTARGISAARLQTDGKGESQPVADNSSESGKAQNRRVEFTVIQ